MIGAVAEADRLENMISWMRPAQELKDTLNTQDHGLESDEQVGLVTQKGLSNEQVGLVPERKAGFGDLLSLIILKAGVYCALPLWLIFRIVDFVVGGPGRRRRVGGV
jgi:hypothetical protein